MSTAFVAGLFTGGILGVLAMAMMAINRPDDHQDADRP